MPELPLPPLHGPTPEELVAHNFPSARRGLDPDAVHSYLAEIADLLRQLRAREALLTERLAAASQPVAPVPLDPAALSAAVGQETARVLQVAHEAAEEVLARATAQADDLRLQASNVFEEEQRRAQLAAAAITAAATAEAEATVNAAREECRQMVEVARAARQRILADLAGRRRELHVQLEQLRAGKDALADVVDAVASYVVHSVEELKDQLAGAEERAHLAAEAVAASPGAYVTELSDEALLEEAAALGAAGAPELAAAGIAGGVVENLVVPVTEAAGEVASESEVVTGAAADDAPEDTSNAIDELFAKIRQSREEQVERARTFLEESPLVEVPTTGEVPSTDAESGPAEHAGPEPEVAAETTAEAAGTPDEHLEPVADKAVADGASGGELADADGADGAADGGSETQERALTARDELLLATTAELTRVLKRQLRLEQNQLLDAFRNLKKGGDPLSLLPGEEMSTRLEGDVRDALVAAFAAGRGFAANSIEREAGPLRQPVAAVGVVATALGGAIVEPIRRRVEQGLNDLSEEPVTAIGAAFREWKGVGAERVAADFAVRAFSAGVLDEAHASGSAVSWIVDDGEQRCPDCDDNAIAGAQPPGQPFPTGHEHPPIHPGCRCLLVLSPA